MMELYLWVKEDGDFLITTMPNTRMPQMDDSRVILNINKHENTRFWFYPVPEYPVPIAEQMRGETK